MIWVALPTSRSALDVGDLLNEEIRAGETSPIFGHEVSKDAKSIAGDTLPTGQESRDRDGADGPHRSIDGQAVLGTDGPVVVGIAMAGVEMVVARM